SRTNPNTKSAADESVASGRYEAAENVGGEGAVHAFGVPLDADHPVGVACPFDSFDDAVGCMRGDAKVAAGCADRLVMGAVDVRGGRAGERHEAGIGNECNVVLRIVAAAFGGVRDVRAGFAGNVLHEAAAAVDVEKLVAVA